MSSNLPPGVTDAMLPCNGPGYPGLLDDLEAKLGHMEDQFTDDATVDELTDKLYPMVQDCIQMIKSVREEMRLIPV